MIMQKIIINFPMTILHEATFPRINEMGRRNREALTICYALKGNRDIVSGQARWMESVFK